MWLRVDWRRLATPTVIVAALFLCACAVSAFSFVSEPRSIEPACWIGDAQNYCAVANGKRAEEPFNRRPAVPYLARVLPGSDSVRFRAVALLSLLAVVVSAIILARRFCSRMDRVQQRATLITLAAALLVMPHGLRLAWSVPVFVDTAALAVGLLWLACFTSHDRRLLLVSCPAVVLAVGTREIWAGVIVAGACLALLSGPRRVAAASIGLAVATYIAVNKIPAAPSSPYLSGVEVTHYWWFPDVMHFWWNVRFADRESVAKMLSFVVFGAGLLPLVLFQRRALRWLRDEIDRHDRTAVTLVVGGGLLVASAPFLGTDVTRLAYPGGVMLMIVALPFAVLRPSWSIIPLAVGTLVIWQPAHGLIATVDEFNTFYLPSNRVGIVAIATVLVVVLAAPIVRMLRPSPARTARHEDDNASLSL